MNTERILLTFVLLCQSISAKNLLEEIRSIPNFSEATRIIESSKSLPVLLETKGFTAFIPTDEAFTKYTGQKNEDLIAYHLANIPYKIQDVPDEITTELSGNPRLYVTCIPSGNPSITGWEDYNYYINNAKVISANHRAETENGEIQYLHTVDQVIAPTVAQVTGPDAHTYRYPDARKFLEHSNIYGFETKHELQDLKTRVEEMNMLETFEMPGKNTFFMPTKHAFKTIPKSDKVLIDKQVIHGHVVPDEVLFTRTVRDSMKQFKSLAFADNLKVFISIENITNPETNEATYYVKSNTVSDGPPHIKGTAIARIVLGNIPVRNGVVHLIDRPLMIVASSIVSYLQQDKGQLMEFNRLLKDHFEDMINMIMTNQDLTLFAPSNKAFEMVNKDRLKEIILKKDKLKKILQLHIVKEILTTDEIVEQSTKEIFQVETMDRGRKLYFAVNDPNAVVPVVSLEGGGVNATITTPNIATKAGVIHIIDRILGIPSQTVYEKLASDPMISSTFSLSQQTDWSRLLNDRKKKFTLFVPSNSAWEYVKREMPSAHKKLFMGAFRYHVRSILQRHLIVNANLSLEDLEKLTTNSTELRENMRRTQVQMARGKIYFEAKVIENFGAPAREMGPPKEGHRGTRLLPEAKNRDEEQEYLLEWNGVTARVIRPNIECVNGIVHVIDKVVMLKSDVSVSGSNRFSTVGGVTTLASTVLTLTLAWVLV